MIVLDVESSGLSPERCSILSIGALDLEDPANQFYEECRVWDGAHVEDSALVVNGFSKADTVAPSKMSEAELVNAFIAWATDKPVNQTLAGQNPSFDRDFLRAACKRGNMEFPFANRTIDTHTLCWFHMTKRGLKIPLANNHSAISLDFALRYCGLPEESKPHNGLMGAYCHAEVISRIAYNRKLLPAFGAYDIPWQTI